MQELKILKQTELNGSIKTTIMNTDFMKPTIITAQQYGTKVSVEIDHSDTDITELFDAFKTICVGLGYADYTFKEWIMNRADEYREEDFEARYSFDDSILQSNKDTEAFFDAITNPSQITEEMKESISKYVANLPTEIVYEDEFDEYGSRKTKNKKK